MTDGELQKLRALAGKATPGPWHFRAGGFGDNRGGHVLHASESDNWTDMPLIIAHYFYGNDEADYSFIAASRTALPALLDLVASLRAELERCRPVVEAAVAYQAGNGTIPAVLIAVDAMMKERPAHADDESRCAVCGWPLVASIDNGCVRGNCSLRPRPDRLYASDRAAKETGNG